MGKEKWQREGERLDQMVFKWIGSVGGLDQRLWGGGFDQMIVDEERGWINEVKKVVCVCGRDGRGLKVGGGKVIEE